jgi:hypothetical protein
VDMRESMPGVARHGFEMPQKRYTAEHIIPMLRRADVELGQGKGSCCRDTDPLWTLRQRVAETTELDLWLSRHDIR